MTDAGAMDWLLTFFIIAGIFFFAYTAYRQQGLIDTVNEIKDAFEDKTESIKDSGMVYR